MSLKFKNRARLAAWLAVGFGVSLGAQARGQQGQKIQFSAPATPVVSVSNQSEIVSPGLNRLSPFRQMQEDLLRPLVNSFNSPEPMKPITPPQMQPVPTRRMREMMDARKNWAFTDLNDLYPDPMLEATANAADAGSSQDKNASSLIERYYNRLGQKNGTNRMSALEAAELNAANPYLMSNGFATMIDPARALTTPKAGSKTEDKDAVTAFRSQNPFYATESREESDAMRKHNNEFRHLLDPGALPIPAPTDAGGSQDPYGLRAATFGSVINPQLPVPAPVVTETHRNSINPIVGTTDPTITALHTHISDDPTAVSLGQPNPQPQPVVVRPTPAQVSLRTLDPYAAAIQKPKF